MKTELRLKKKNDLKRRLKKYRALYFILAVCVAYYFLFLYVPIFSGIIISFKDMKVGSSVMNAKWVGLENYRYVLHNPEMFKLLRNTLIISCSRLIFTFLPPIILTIIIFDLRSKRFQKLCQTTVYIPHFFSWVIIYGIAFAFFSGSGLINDIVEMLGGKRVDFFTSKKAFVPMLIGTQIWKEAGWGTILYFAALTGINPELYEAAKIDGAGPLQRIKAVTLPAMLPIITFSLIMALGSILNNDFEQIMLFYNPAVYEVGDIIDTWVYRVGLGRMEYGVGAAVSMLKAIVSLILIVSANAFSKKTTGRGMF